MKLGIIKLAIVGSAALTSALVTGCAGDPNDLLVGDRNGAVMALQQVPPTSNLYTRAKVEIARILVDRQLPVATNIPKHPQPTISELKSANQTVEALTLEGIEKHRLDRGD